MGFGNEYLKPQDNIQRANWSSEFPGIIGDKFYLLRLMDAMGKSVQFSVDSADHKWSWTNTTAGHQTLSVVSGGTAGQITLSAGDTYKLLTINAVLICRETQNVLKVMAKPTSNTVTVKKGVFDGGTMNTITSWTDPTADEFAGKTFFIAGNLHGADATFGDFKELFSREEIGVTSNLVSVYRYFPQVGQTEMGVVDYSGTTEMERQVAKFLRDMAVDMAVDTWASNPVYMPSTREFKTCGILRMPGVTPMSVGASSFDFKSLVSFTNDKVLTNNPDITDIDLFVNPKGYSAIASAIRNFSQITLDGAAKADSYGFAFNEVVIDGITYRIRKDGALGQATSLPTMVALPLKNLTFRGHKNYPILEENIDKVNGDEVEKKKISGSIGVELRNPQETCVLQLTS